MKEPAFFVALQLRGKKCVVVGGGVEAAYRVKLLSEHGADVLSVASVPSAELAQAVALAGATFRQRDVADADVADAWLVVLADVSPELAERLGKLCGQSRTLFCAVDQGAESSFHHVAIARAGLVSVAIGTDGRVPGLARRLREEIARVLTISGLAEFAERVARLRERTAPGERRDIVNRAVAGVRLTGALELPEDVTP